MRLKYVDSKHAYYLDGKQCRSVTNVAGLPDDKFNLEQWRARHIVIAMAQSEDLRAKVLENIDDRLALNGLLEEAIVLAGGRDAASRGTAAHKVIETRLTGDGHGNAGAEPYLWETFKQLVSEAGFRVRRDLIERVVLHPDQRIAGRFDLVIERISDGALFIADLKTGLSSVRYPHSVAIQLALYAHAPLIASARLGLDDETTEFEPAPVLDKNVGYMIHIPLPPDDDYPPQLYKVNLRLGWKAAQSIVFPALRWRLMKRSRLIVPVA